MADWIRDRARIPDAPDRGMTMTEDRKAVFETIDSLRQQENYIGILEIAKYALDSIYNDYNPEGETL